MKKISKTVSTSVGDVAITFQSAKGGKEGPLVVFLHGWGSDHSVWKEQIASCPQATLAIDLPGFGASPEPANPLVVVDYASAVTEIIGKCGWEEVIVVGHSFGGQVAAELATHAPDWLTGLLLVSSASLRSRERPLLSKFGEFFGPVFRLPFLRSLRPVIYKFIGADLPPESAVMRATMRQVLRTDQLYQLAEIKVPTQLVWGESDTATPLADGKLMAERIEKSQLTVLSGGHFIFLDQPTAFADILRSFINQIS
ncbi:MAG: alpha/beta hydrolase [Candidatus Paceibacterota bacterium]